MSSAVFGIIVNYDKIVTPPRLYNILENKAKLIQQLT